MIDLAAELDVRTVSEQDDPLLCKAPFPYRGTFYPLGFAIEVVTNDRAVLNAAGESWGGFESRGCPKPVARLMIGITDSTSWDCPPAPTVRAQEHLMSLVADADNQIICDLRRGFAFGWLTSSALRHESYFRYHFLEAAALVIISTMYATPIHAACASSQGRGVLLCGGSGAGKSSLAYACARSGWTFTSDDASYILRAGEPGRVIGNSRRFRFRPSAESLFPEIRGRSVTARAEGKPSIEVEASELGKIVTSDEAAVHYIVVLDRQPSGAADLIPIPVGDALDRFHRAIYFTAEIEREQAASLRALSAARAYVFRYSDLTRAVALLDELVEGEQQRIA